MKNRSDIDRVLATWMADGPAAIPDRVVDIVAARIGVQRQRRTWPFPRRTTVTTQIKLIAALAAALVVAVVGYNLLPGTAGPGGPTTGPTPTAQPTAAPTAAAPTAAASTAAAVLDLPDGVLQEGRYRIGLSFIDPTLSVVAEVPAGWNGFPDVAAVTSAEGENKGALVSFMEVDGLFSDPCQWDLNGSGDPGQPGDVQVGPSVDDLVAALKANSSYASTAPKPVTIGQFAGQELELQLPSSDAIQGCDRRDGQTAGDYFVFPGGFWALSSNNRWHLYLVDVNGTRLIILVSLAEGTAQADITAAEAIVKSFEIVP